MVFWLSILVAIAFLSLAVKLGLYETWAILFNAAIAVYLAIALNPIIKPLLPDEASSSFDDMVVMLFLGISFFSIIHSIIYIFIIGQFKINTGKIFDTLGAAGLGFLLGLLVFDFILITVLSSPLASNRTVKQIGIEREKTQANIMHITRYIDLMHNVVGDKQKEKLSDTLENILRKYDKSKTETPSAPEPQESESKIIHTPLELPQKIDDSEPNKQS